MRLTPRRHPRASRSGAEAKRTPEQTKRANGNQRRRRRGRSPLTRLANRPLIPSRSALIFTVMRFVLYFSGNMRFRRSRASNAALSGGQKQRLITASTLAMGQKIIILDEPLANLDKDGAAMLMGTLRSLVKAGYCVVVIEHRFDMVLPFVDVVWHIGDKTVKKVEDKAAYLQAQTAKIGDNCPIYAGGSPLFELKSVKFSVKEREILKDISLEIPKGGRTVFLGENGCGKTTLMRLIARLYKPTGGTILQYIDEKFKQKPRGSRAWFKKVGVVYQNPDYQLFMPTVEKEIKFGAPSPEYAEHIAELFGIKYLWHRHPQSLSEGQKRRVSIAAVVACRPEVLLLDEPTVGQDYDGLCQMVEILNKLHEQTGNTMITITHDVRCAEALCDRAYLIANGIIQKSGGKELVREYFMS